MTDMAGQKVSTDIVPASTSPDVPLIAPKTESGYPGQHDPEWPLGERRRLLLAITRTRDVALVVATFAGVIGLWELISVATALPSYILPTPGQVASALLNHRGVLASSTLTTTEEILLGFLIGSVFGTALAAVVVAARKVERIIMPLIVGTQAVPKIAIAPLFLLWFGIGMLPKVIIAALLAFFPVIVNTATGLKSVDPALTLMARSTRASRRRIFLKIELPLAAPSVFAGLKLGVTLAAIGAVVGEFISATSGLGSIIVTTQGQQQTSYAFAAIIVLSILTLILYYVVALIEFLLLRQP